MSRECEIFFLDLQGFKSENNSFIVKEICLLSKNQEASFLFIIKPPFPYKNLSFQCKKQTEWLSKNYHGLHWKDGFISYENAKEALLLNLPKLNVNIFVNGEEKKKWASQVLGENEEINYYNIAELGYNNNFITNNIENCKYHQKEFVCTYKNVIKMKKWFALNYHSINIL